MMILVTREELKEYFNIDSSILKTLEKENNLKKVTINEVLKYNLSQVLPLFLRLEKRDSDFVFEQQKALLDFKKKRKKEKKEKWELLEEEENFAIKQGINTKSRSKLRFFHSKIKELYEKGWNINQIQNEINSKLPRRLSLPYCSYQLYINTYIKGKKSE